MKRSVPKVILTVDSSCNIVLKQINSCCNIVLDQVNSSCNIFLKQINGSCSTILKQVKSSYLQYCSKTIYVEHEGGWGGGGSFSMGGDAMFITRSTDNL